MVHKEFLEVLGPCGLNCNKCFAYSKGEIRETSIKLQQLLGSFDRYAERFKNFLPVFENYPVFKELLNFLTQSDCAGCREGECKYPNCGVITCYKTKGVEFCFECKEFPCDKSNFDPDLKRRWIEMNNHMKKDGVDSYYEQTKDLPRYR